MNMIRETKIYICIDAPCIEILQTPTLHQTTSHAPFPQAESLAYHQPVATPRGIVTEWAMGYISSGLS